LVSPNGCFRPLPLRPSIPPQPHTGPFAVQWPSADFFGPGERVRRLHIPLLICPARETWLPNVFPPSPKPAIFCSLILVLSRFLFVYAIEEVGPIPPIHGPSMPSCLLPEVGPDKLPSPGLTSLMGSYVNPPNLYQLCTRPICTCPRSPLFCAPFSIPAFLAHRSPMVRACPPPPPPNPPSRPRSFPPVPALAIRVLLADPTGSPGPAAHLHLFIYLFIIIYCSTFASPNPSAYRTPLPPPRRLAPYRRFLAQTRTCRVGPAKSPQVVKIHTCAEPFNC